MKPMAAAVRRMERLLCFPMQSASPSNTSPAPRTIATAVLVWAAISALGALQTYSDNLRGGVDSHYPALLVTGSSNMRCR